MGDVEEFMRKLSNNEYVINSEKNIQFIFPNKVIALCLIKLIIKNIILNCSLLNIIN
jgi:hypothetical protein